MATGTWEGRALPEGRFLHFPCVFRSLLNLSQLSTGLYLWACRALTKQAVKRREKIIQGDLIPSDPKFYLFFFF